MVISRKSYQRIIIVVFIDTEDLIYRTLSEPTLFLARYLKMNSYRQENDPVTYSAANDYIKMVNNIML